MFSRLTLPSLFLAAEPGNGFEFLGQLPTLITALVGAFVAYTAWYNSKLGRKDTAEQQQAANKLQQDENQFAQQAALIEAHRTEIARLVAARTDDSNRYDEELARTRRRHSEEIDEMRRLWMAERAAGIEQITALRADIATLSRMVVSEANQTAAEMVIETPTKPPEAS